METLGVVFVFSFAIVQAFAQCNLPPSWWCSSRDAAKLCQVERDCELSGKLAPVTNPGPVNITLYYESLCPGCKQFIETQLFTAYQKIGKIMNITLVPYGNADETKDGSEWKFQCQHGPQECVGNIIEACAIYYGKTIENYFPFIHCMEGSKQMPTPAAKECATKFPVAINDILDCANSSLGNQLEHQMALKTNALSPPHYYVPWVTVNGVHTEKIQNEAESDLIRLICDTYQGAKPAGCNEIKEEEALGWRSRTVPRSPRSF